MSVDFRQLLSKPLDDVKRPPPLPGGTYKGRVKGFELGESTQKKTPFVRFNLSVESPGEDVPAESLVDIDLTKKSLRRDYFLTEDAYYRVKEFLESLGINTSGRTLDETLPETQNAEVLMTVVLSLNRNDPKAPPYNEVSDIVGIQS